MLPSTDGIVVIVRVIESWEKALVFDDGLCQWTDPSSEAEPASWMSLADVARAYLDEHPRPDCYDAASEFVTSLAADGRPLALEMVRALIAEARSEDDLAFIGAVPLQTILSDYERAPAYVAATEEWARADPKLSRALAHVTFDEAVAAEVVVRYRALTEGV